MKHFRIILFFISLTNFYAIGQQHYGFNKFLHNNKIETPFTTNGLFSQMLPNDSLGSFNPIAPIKYFLTYADTIKTILTENGFNESLGTALTFVSDFIEASKTFNKAYANESRGKIGKEDLGVVENFENELLSKAKKTKFVLINEAHHLPEHRLYTTSLLPKLYKTGYRYLALEALSNRANIGKVTTLNTYTGLYTSEPFFGDLVREALKIGFTLIPYEDYTNASSSSVRDSFMAENILEFIKNDSNAKVVVHAGFGHIGEEKIFEYTPLGYLLKKKTGIDPITINQTEFCYAYGSNWEMKVDSFFTPLIKNSNKDELFFTNKTLKHSDYFIYRKPLLNNSWKLRYSLREKKEIKIDKKFFSKTFLIQLYDKKEWLANKEKAQLIPIDQAYYYPNKQLYMYPRKNREYIIVIRDFDNAILSLK